MSKMENLTYKELGNQYLDENKNIWEITNDSVWGNCKLTNNHGVVSCGLYEAKSLSGLTTIKVFHTGQFCKKIDNVYVPTSGKLVSKVIKPTNEMILVRKDILEKLYAAIKVQEQIIGEGDFENVRFGDIMIARDELQAGKTYEDRRIVI